MANKVVYHPRTGERCTFYEDRHIYQLDNGYVFTSGTKFLHSVFPKFDSQGISKRVAEKQGKTQAEVLAEWNQAGVFGTNVHNYAEALLGDYPDIPEPLNVKEEDYFKTVKAVCDVFRQRYKILALELIVFSPQYGIAGMVDLLMTDGKSIIIADWKTNKAVNRSNYFRGKDQKAYPPIAHFDNCNFNHYQFQLNLYQKLMLDEGYIPSNRFIKRMLMHVKPSSKGGCEIMPVEDLQPNMDRIFGYQGIKKRAA